MQTTFKKIGTSHILAQAFGRTADAAPFASEGILSLVLLDRGEGTYERYATAWYRDEAPDHFLSHYFSDYARAQADYIDRWTNYTNTKQLENKPTAVITFLTTLRKCQGRDHEANSLKHFGCGRHVTQHAYGVPETSMCVAKDEMWATFVVQNTCAEVPVSCCTLCVVPALDETLRDATYEAEAAQTAEASE